MSVAAASFVALFAALFGYAAWWAGRRRAGAGRTPAMALLFACVIAGAGAFLSALRASRFRAYATEASVAPGAALPEGGAAVLLDGRVSERTERACAPYVACAEWHEDTSGRTTSGVHLRIPSVLIIDDGAQPLEVTIDYADRSGWPIVSDVSLRRTVLEAGDPVGIAGFIEDGAAMGSGERVRVVRATRVVHGGLDALRAEARSSVMAPAVFSIVLCGEALILLVLAAWLLLRGR